MKDSRLNTEKRLDEFYQDLIEEINSDDSDNARIAARAAQYAGWITGITQLGFSITIHEHGRHAIDLEGKLWTN